MNKTVANILSSTIAVLLLLLYIVWALYIPAFTKSFYTYEFDRHSVYEAVEMEKIDLLLVRDKLINYMSGRDDTLQIVVPIQGERNEFFSQRELSHMEDVRGLFELTSDIQTVGLIGIFVCLIIYYYLQREFKLLGKVLRIASVLWVSLLSVFGILSYFFFDKAFTYFHLILFTNDLWLLDPSVDRLINILPTAFFQDAAVLVAWTLVFLVTMQFFVGRWIEKATKR